MIENDFFIHYHDSERSSYDIYKFFIYLKFYESEKDDPIKRVEYTAETVHEYIHYLQSFTTIYGIQTTLILLSILNEFLLDLNNSAITFPLKADDPIIQIMRERMKLIYDLQFFQMQPKDLSVEDEKYYEMYKIKYNGNKEVKVLFIKDHNNHRWIPLTPKVIRENMAMMGYCITRGMDAKALLEWIKERDDSEYWIIFEYLMYNARTPLNNLVITFYLCELALMSSTPTITIDILLNHFIEFIHSEGIHYSDEDSLFNDFVKKYEIITEQQPWIDKLFEVTQVQKNSADQNSYDNEYLKFLSTIFQIIINALVYRRNQATVYKKGLGGLWIDNMTQMFASPVVSYRDPKIFLLGKSYISTEPHAYIFSLLFFMQNIESLNKLDICPFYKNFPICNEEKSNICEKHPLNILYDEKYAGCALYNVLQLLGLLK